MLKEVLRVEGASCWRCFVLKVLRVQVKVQAVRKAIEHLSSQGYLVQDGYSNKGLREDNAEVSQHL